MRKTALKGFSELNSALGNAYRATPTTLSPRISGTPEGPEVSVSRRERAKPTPHDDIAEMRGMRLALMAGWYETTISERRREPDPTREYLGPRFCPPTPKGQGRKKPFAQS